MSSRIPAGWEYWSSELSQDDAWRTAIAWKETRERVRGDVFVRVRVVQGPGDSWWILRREELRESAA